MDRMTFIGPVNVGELVTCTASVNAAWRTSMEVGVRVEAESPLTGERRHTSTAYLTMVAVDEDGSPTPVPPLLVDSEARGAPPARGRAAPDATGSPSARRSCAAAATSEAHGPARRPPRSDASRSSSRLPTAKTAIHRTTATVVLTKAIGDRDQEHGGDEQVRRPGHSMLELARLGPDQIVAIGVHDLRLKGDADADQVDRVEDHRGGLTLVVAQHLPR